MLSSFASNATRYQSAAVAAVAEPKRAQAPPQALVIGDTSVGIRDAREFQLRRSELMGSLSARATPASAGSVLAFVDACCSRGTTFFASGKLNTGNDWLPVDGFTISTIAFNSFVFRRPIFDGDQIIVDATVIHAGGSSMGVHIGLHRQSYDCPTPSLVGESYVTMVMVDAKQQTKPLKGRIPAVRLTLPEDIHHYHNYLCIRQELQQMNGKGPEGLPKLLTPADVVLPQNARKQKLIPMSATTTITDKRFGITKVNLNGVIFGGSILRHMEKAALHCARVFAQEPRLFCLGMLGASFHSPIGADDGARCYSTVTCVRGSTLLVHMRVEADTRGERRLSNQAYFMFIAADEAGVPMPIRNGLDLSNATQHELGMYLHSRKLMEVSAELRS